MQLIRGVLGHDGPHAHQVHSCLRAGHDAVLPAVRHGVLLWLHGLWQEVDGSILLMYDPLREPEVMVAYVGVLSKLCSPTRCSLCLRNAIYHIIGWDADELPYWKHCIAVTILSTIVLFCGLFIPKIQLCWALPAPSQAALSAIFFRRCLRCTRGLDVEEGGMRHYVCTYILLLSVSLARRVRYWCDDLGHRLRLEGNGSLYMNGFSFFLFNFEDVGLWEESRMAI
ncbi:hypothetical protein TcBrA4_0034840 [Trypanosoma cruzi]|nr:hypothetical protein TcBrA4_0034840 [Trypanosoma cruzi]